MNEEKSYLDQFTLKQLENLQTILKSLVDSKVLNNQTDESDINDLLKSLKFHAELKQQEAQIEGLIKTQQEQDDFDLFVQELQQENDETDLEFVERNMDDYRQFFGDNHDR